MALAPVRRRARAEVAEHVDDSVRRLTIAWTRAYDLIAGDLERDAYEAARLGPLSAADFRAGRLASSVNVAAGALNRAAAFSGVTVTGNVPAVVNGSAAVQASYLFGRARGVGINVNLPPEDRLARIVQRSTQQIASRFQILSIDAERSLRDNLIRGVARGAGPRDVATRIVENTKGAFAGGLTRANNLARTELIDSSRVATREVYRANGNLVTGWTWSSARDRRTCPACWAMDGTLHGIEETLEGHQQCRCVMVPALSTDTPADRPSSAEAAFSRLPEKDRLEIMGARRLEYLDQGGRFVDLAVKRDNPGWRPGHYVRPLRDLDGPISPVRGSTEIPTPAAPPPPPAPPTGHLLLADRQAEAARLALDSDVDPFDTAGLRDELQGARILALNRYKAETGGPVLTAEARERLDDDEYDPWLSDTLRVDDLAPEVQAWLRKNPQPTLGEYAAAAKARKEALDALQASDTSPADVDAWADEWGATENALAAAARVKRKGPNRLEKAAALTREYEDYVASLPPDVKPISRDRFRRTRNPSSAARNLDDEYTAYREQFALEAEQATRGNFAARSAPPDAGLRISAWLSNGGTPPPLKWMSEELQRHLGVGQYGGNSVADAVLSRRAFRKTRGAQDAPDDPTPDVPEAPAPPPPAPKPPPAPAPTPPPPAPATASRFTAEQLVDALDPTRKRSKAAILKDLEATPAGKDLAASIKAFTETRGGVANLRKNIEAVRAGTASSAVEARVKALLDAVNTYPTENVPTLYRGIAVKVEENTAAWWDRFEAGLKPGQTLDLNLSSFSSSQKKAAEFERMIGGTRRVTGDYTAVRYVLEDGTALPVERLSKFASEKEWITGGKFEIVDYTPASKAQPYYRVVIRQQEKLK